MSEAYRIIAEFPAAAAITAGVMLNGGATGVRMKLVDLPVDQVDHLAAVATTFAEIGSCTVNLLPGADPAASQAAAAARGWDYDAAMTPAELAAITAARQLALEG